VRELLDVIEGKWKPIIVNALKPGTLRFGQKARRRWSRDSARQV